MTYPPGEGPLTEAEAKEQLAAEVDDNDDVEPPSEPLTDALDDPAHLNEEGEPE